MGFPVISCFCLSPGGKSLLWRARLRGISERRQEGVNGNETLNIHEVIKMQPCPTRPHCCYQTGIDNFFELNSVVKGEIKKMSFKFGESPGNRLRFFYTHWQHPHTTQSWEWSHIGFVLCQSESRAEARKAACYPGVSNDRLTHRFVTVRNLATQNTQCTTEDTHFNLPELMIANIVLCTRLFLESHPFQRHE